MTLSASLVVVMGTQYYDASGATGGADYSVTDLLQIMGRASRPDDAGGRSVTFYYSTLAPFGVATHVHTIMLNHTFVAKENESL